MRRSLILSILLCCPVWTSLLSAQTPNTTVQGTIVGPGGSNPSGTAVISWGRYLNDANPRVTVYPGQEVITITNGVVNVSLFPNSVALPPAQCYRISYNLAGVNTTRYWYIPVSATPVPINLVEGDIPCSTQMGSQVAPAQINPGAPGVTQVLTSSPLGLVSWVTGGGGGGGNPGGTNGQIQYNNLGAFGGFTFAGDCLVTVPNIVCTKTNGVAFAASATTDTTNASNITSGTLNAARLPTSVPTSVTNDTNVTGSISGNALVLGWQSTLAAGRLNSNVVQAITNDTNITGSITSQNLTLGWTGTLAAGRLNSNVVQSVVNDTNVTGSISAQALTLGWTGTLAKARIIGTAVYNDQSNTWSTGAQSWASATHTTPTIVVASSGALPATCTTGELGFVTGATAGQQIYECSGTNTWTQQLNSGGGSGATVFTQLGNGAVTRTSSTVLTIDTLCSSSLPCPVGVGNTTYVFTGSATATISAGSPTAYIYVDTSGTLSVGVSSGTVVCSGCTTTNVAAFPADVVKIATWTASSGTWQALGYTDYRNALYSKPNTTAGTCLLQSSGQLSLDPSCAEMRRVCTIVVGANNASAALQNADLGPQGRQCFIPSAATVLEVTVSADAGTPTVVPARNHAGTLADLVSAALSTAASGGLACSNVGGTVGIDGATTCSGTLQNATLAAGDWIDLDSGATAGGTAKRMSIAITWSPI